MIVLCSMSFVHAQTNEEYPLYKGVNLKGLFTSISQQRGTSDTLPVNYYEDSLKLITQAGMNHVRYLYYWESYASNPSVFIKEIENFANLADKYGIKVIYDNHQFHTSSWLNTARGTGFPASLFVENQEKFPNNGGGGPKYAIAEKWWNDWWNRSIKDANGNDGWILLADFLKEMVGTLDRHPSTLGYEILSEPQVHSNDQWDKVSVFNTFMVDELRKVTNKTIAYSQQIPASINDPKINVTSENMAKMTPQNKENTVFKFSLYGIPKPDTFQGDRFVTYLKAAQLAGVPPYIGEFNNIDRDKTTNEEGEKVWIINSSQSNLRQHDADVFMKYFRDTGIWGWAFWHWNFKQLDTPNFNLINVTEDERIHPTIYYTILKNAIASSNVTLLLPAYFQEKLHTRVMLAFNIINNNNLPGWCDNLSDTLKKYNIKATVFIPGSIAERFPKCVSLISSNKDMDIGSSTYNYSNLVSISDYSIALKEVKNGKKAIDETGKLNSKVFRAPYGATDENIYSLLTRAGILADFSYTSQYNTYDGKQFIKYDIAAYNASDSNSTDIIKGIDKNKPVLINFDNSISFKQIDTLIDKIKSEISDVYFTSASELTHLPLTTRK